VAKVGEGQQDCQPAPHYAPTSASSARLQDAAIHTRRRRCRTHARSTGCALRMFDEQRRKHGAAMRWAKPSRRDAPAQEAASSSMHAGRCARAARSYRPVAARAPSAASMTARGGPCAGAARPMRRRCGWRAWPCVPVRLGRRGGEEGAARRGLQCRHIRSRTPQRGLARSCLARPFCAQRLGCEALFARSTLRHHDARAQRPPRCEHSCVEGTVNSAPSLGRRGTSRGPAAAPPHRRRGLS
jgi:hypothetical protein